MDISTVPKRKKALRAAVYALTAVLSLVLLLWPGFCDCPTCVVVGSKAEPCHCSVLGVYLGRRAVQFLSKGSNTARRADSRAANVPDCHKK